MTDPVSIGNARAKQPELQYADTVEEAVAGSELVLLLTEWDEFVGLDPEVVGPTVTERRILDGRNALDPSRWRAAGWTYRALGRGKG